MIYCPIPGTNHEEKHMNEFMKKKKKLGRIFLQNLWKRPERLLVAFPELLFEYFLKELLEDQSKEHGKELPMDFLLILLV